MPGRSFNPPKTSRSETAASAQSSSMERTGDGDVIDLGRRFGRNGRNGARSWDDVARKHLAFRSDGEKRDEDKGEQDKSDSLGFRHSTPFMLSSSETGCAMIRGKVE